MKEHAEKLNQLGKIDFQLDQLKNAINAKPENLAQAEKNQKIEKRHLQNKHEETELLQRRIQEHQRLIELEKEKLQSVEKQLLEPQGQKVFLKVKENISLIKKFIQKSEQAISGFNLKKEELARQIEISNDSFDKFQSEIGEIETEMSSKIAIWKKDLEELEKQREEVKKGISGKLLWKYNKLLERGLLPPVTEVTTNYCSVCSISFPAQVYQQLLLQHIGECSHCLRIIVEAPVKDLDKTEEQTT